VSFARIDVDQLVGRPGATREAEVRGPVEGLGTELAEPRGPVTVTLRLEWVGEGVLVTGRVAGELSMRCARCLTAFERPFRTEVGELFAVGPTDDPDAYSLDAEGRVDPDQMVRDAIGVELPFAPLCRPDCLGLCEICGADRNVGGCPGHESTDPRWDGLDAVLAMLED
jgi:uncharacterized protein